MYVCVYIYIYVNASVLVATMAESKQRRVLATFR